MVKLQYHSNTKDLLQTLAFSHDLSITSGPQFPLTMAIVIPATIKCTDITCTLKYMLIDLYIYIIIGYFLPSHKIFSQSEKDIVLPFMFLRP